MIVTHEIPMDLKKLGNSPCIPIMQGESCSRRLQFCLTLEGKPWVIPQGVKALIRYGKPDGTGGEYDTLPSGDTAWEVATDTVTVTLAPQVCTVAGQVQLTVMLLQETCRISTFRVILLVQPQPEFQGDSENYQNVTLSSAEPGKSAYEIALEQGFSGSESEWLLSLQGEPGRTPVKGVDYWTAEDQAEMVSQSAAPVFAETIDACTDQSKLYVLPDGYVYAYRQGADTVTENLFDADACTLNKYISSSSGDFSSSAANGCVSTDFIAIDSDRFLSSDSYTLAIQGVTLAVTPSRLSYYLADKSFTRQATFQEPDGELVSSLMVETERSGDSLLVHINKAKSESTLGLPSGVAYIRLSLYISTAALTQAPDITITEGTGEAAGFASTGVQYACHVLTDTDRTSIAQKVLELLEVSHITIENTIALGTYTLAYENAVDTAEIGQVVSQ